MSSNARRGSSTAIGMVVIALSCGGDPVEGASASDGETTTSGSATSLSASGVDTTTEADSISTSTAGDSGESGDGETTQGDTTGARQLCRDGIVAAGELCLFIADSYPVGDQPRSITVGDFDDDGHLDLAVGSHNSQVLTVLIGTGDGTFTATEIQSIAGHVNDVFADDIDSDGRDDVVIADTDGRQLVAYLSDGVLPMIPVVTHVTDKPRRVVVIDIDGNAAPDAVMTLADQDAIRVGLGNGVGGFTVQPGTAVGAGPTRLAVGDIDGDDDLDVATANDGAKTVTVLFNQAGLVADDDYATANNPNAAKIADFDGDDAADLLITNRGSDSMTLWINTGTGAFMASSTTPVGDDPQDLAVADLDADGLPDAAIPHAKGDDDVSIFVGDGAAGFAAPRVIGVGNDPSAILSGDFNEDGALDLAVTNFGDQDVLLILSDP